MKKYKIDFTTDYTELERWAKDGSIFWEQVIKRNPKEVDRCRKWKDKEITILELESLIDELGTVVFDGHTIEVYNDYRE